MKQKKAILIGVGIVTAGIVIYKLASSKSSPKTTVDANSVKNTAAYQN